VWRRDIDGLSLTFHLAGINDQNFLMRDQETGTYWQQVTGLAISGPLAGRRLTPVESDELTAATWKAEQPGGTVLRDVAAYKDDYASKDWDVRMKKAPTVVSFAAPGLAQRDIMLGIHVSQASRAFPLDEVLRRKLVEDAVGTEPVMLVVGPDGRSVRAFRRRIAGRPATAQFYRIVEGASASRLFIDDATASEWNFQGCATSGAFKGTCLERIAVIKDYWFDWRDFNPSTTVYEHPRK
jgi:hypothetical protein